MPAHAAAQTCNGLTPTKLVSAGTQDFTGTDKDDVIAIVGSASSHPTVVHAGAGADVICNLSGNRAIIFGDKGDDTFYGSGTVQNFFYGGLGNDAAFGGAGNDTFHGGAGDDFLVGGKGNDVLSGNAGDDVVDGGYGLDTVIGGDGKDVVSGSGMETGDDKMQDVIYATADEIYPRGVGDKVLAKASDLAAYNAAGEKAFRARFKGNSMSAKNTFGGEQVPASVVARRAGGYIEGFWING
jgi:Ca2+-binding RTX toxin-like protein